jgi:hypothetical protein
MSDVLIGGFFIWVTVVAALILMFICGLSLGANSVRGDVVYECKKVTT